MIRKKILGANKGLKIAEALILTIITVTIMYMAVTFNYWHAHNNGIYQGDSKNND